MTVEQVLEMTAKMLGEIRVPANEIQGIGIPIAQCINNLNECIKAIQANKEKPQEEAAPEDAQELPEIRIVPAEDAEEKE